MGAQIKDAISSWRRNFVRWHLTPVSPPQGNCFVTCNTYGGSRCVYRVLVGKPEEKKSLGRPRRRWEDNIKMDLQEIGCGVMDWIELAEDRDRWRALVNAVMNLQVP